MMLRLRETKNVTLQVRLGVDNKLSTSSRGRTPCSEDRTFVTPSTAHHQAGVRTTGHRTNSHQQWWAQTFHCQFNYNYNTILPIKRQ